ncbi:MAG: DUF1444 family protein [Cyanobacteria bacterium HKST-UBA01]|nr:DUF1444 family protein [Cyanobacteria bacterium HKST-UBA01]
MKRLSACAESYFFLILAVICFGCTAPDVSGIKSSALNADSDSKMSEKSNSKAIDWDPRIEAPDLTKEEFTRMCAKILKSAHPELKVEILEPLLIEYSWGKSEESGFMQLENAWKSCASEPGNRKKRLTGHYSNFVELDTEYIDDPERLSGLVVPLLRTKSYFGDEENFEAVVSKSIGADLFLVYGLDKKNNISYLMKYQRKLIKLDDASLLRLAKKNLSHVVSDEDGTVGFVEKDKYVMLLCGGDYESSLIFLDETFEAIKPKVDGRYVFAVPSRDVVLIAGDRSKSAIDFMRGFSKKYFKEGDHVISDRLYRYDDGKITFYE